MKSKPTIQRVGPLVFFLAVSAFSLVVVLAGCSNNSTSLGDTTQQDQTSFFDLPFDPDALAKRVDVEIDTIVEYVSFIAVDDGGVIIFGEPDIADAFVVQPLSFPFDTTFVMEITKLITVDGDLPIIFDCGPDGIEFSKPAILRINAWEDFGKNTEYVRLYWLDEETHEWVDMGEEPVDLTTGYSYLEIGHFSKYGVDKSDGPPGDPKGGGGSEQGIPDK